MASLVNVRSSLMRAGRRLDAPGQPDALNVREVDALVSRLLGEIKNTGPTRKGGTRVGVEFSGLSETELSILGAMEMTATAW